MRLGLKQKAVLNLLEKEGMIENLGRTYRSYCASARQTNNTTIMNFVEKVKIIYPNATLELGKKGGLDTASLKIK